MIDTLQLPALQGFSDRLGLHMNLALAIVKHAEGTPTSQIAMANEIGVCIPNNLPITINPIHYAVHFADAYKFAPPQTDPFDPVGYRMYVMGVFAPSISAKFDNLFIKINADNDRVRLFIKQGLMDVSSVHLMGAKLLGHKEGMEIFFRQMDIFGYPPYMEYYNAMIQNEKQSVEENPVP